MNAATPGTGNRLRFCIWKLIRLPPPTLKMRVELSLTPHRVNAIITA